MFRPGSKIYFYRDIHRHYMCNWCNDIKYSHCHSNGSSHSLIG